MTITREDAVRKALELAPVSVLGLATEAGVSARLLRMIRDGERVATLTSTRAILAAVERLAGRHEAAARVLRESLEDTEDDHA